MRTMLRDSLIPFTLFQRSLRGKYPNYKQSYPKDDFNAAEIERELMQECVHEGCPLVSDEKVTLRIKKNEMEITGQSTLGDACESMGIGYEGEETAGIFQSEIFIGPSKVTSKRQSNFGVSGTI